MTTKTAPLAPDPAVDKPTGAPDGVPNAGTLDDTFRHSVTEQLAADKALSAKLAVTIADLAAPPPPRDRNAW